MIQVILARYLGPGIFGLYSIGWALLRVIGLISPLGFEQGIIHFGLNYRNKNIPAFRNTFFLAFLITLISSGGIAALLFILSPFISQVVFKKPDLEIFLKIFALSIPFVALLRLFSTATTISKSTKYSVISEEIGQPIIELIIIILVIWGRAAVLGVLWAAVISFCFALLLSLIFVYKLFPEVFSKTIKFEKELARSLLLFSVPVAAANFFALFISWVDRILVGIYLPSEDAGIYASVSLASVLFVTILSGIKVIFSPMIADFFHRGENQNLEDIYRISTKWGLYFSLPVGLFFFFNSRDFLSFVFGPEYSIGAVPLAILVIGQLINIGTGPVDISLIMTNRNKDWLWLSSIAFFIDLFLNSILIPRFGIIGAAAGTSITISSLYLVGLFIIKIRIKIWPYERRFLKGIIAALSTSIVLYLIKSLHLPVFLSLTASSLFAILTFGGALFLLKPDKEDAWVIEKVQQRIGQSLSLWRRPG